MTAGGGPASAWVAADTWLIGAGRMGVLGGEMEARAPRTRTILVIGEANGRGAPPVGGAPPGGHFHMVTNAVRILMLLRDAVRGRAARLILEGEGRPYRVILGSVTSEPGRGYSGAIAIEARRVRGDFADAPVRRGQPVTVWFAHGTGIFGFRCRVVGCGAERLLLDLPQSLVRYSRRSTPRFAVPEGHRPGIVLPLVDRTWIRDGTVVDISTGGLAVVLPADVRFPLGGVTRIGLRLHAETCLDLMAACRHSRLYDDDHFCHGLQFLDPPPVAVLAIQRYVEKVQARPTEEAEPPHLPSLPPDMAGRSGRREGGSALPPALTPEPLDGVRGADGRPYLGGR